MATKVSLRCVIQEVADGPGPRDLPRRRLLQAVQLLERAVETVEHAIELHAHLKGQRPAGDVVGRRRRPAGIGKSSGWSCGSNMSSTCGRNACADFTTNEPAG